MDGKQSSQAHTCPQRTTPRHLAEVGVDGLDERKIRSSNVADEDFWCINYLLKSGHQPTLPPLSVLLGTP